MNERRYANNRPQRRRPPPDRTNPAVRQRKGLVAIAENIAQLQLDVAKLDARVAAIDSQVVAIRKHFDRQLTERADEKTRRDFDLERAVFGQSRSPGSKQTDRTQSEGRRSNARPSARKGKSKQPCCLGQ
jgi:hypothetical protein